MEIIGVGFGVKDGVGVGVGTGVIVGVGVAVGIGVGGGHCVLQQLQQSPAQHGTLLQKQLPLCWFMPELLQHADFTPFATKLIQPCTLLIVIIEATNTIKKIFLVTILFSITVRH